MMLTKEQIETWRSWLNEYAKEAHSTANAANALCDMALAGLAVQPRPIEEFDEHNPPLGWFPVRDKDGRWEPAVWRDDGFYLFGGDAPLHPTHFLTALPTPAGRE